MAYARAQWWGLQVFFDDNETQILIATHGSAALVSAAIAGFTWETPIGWVAAITTAITWLGAAALTLCNAPRRGIIVTVLWIGVPWCDSQ